MRLMTEVEINRKLPKLQHRHRVMVIGSCFSEEMGAKLIAGGFRVEQNPFGIMYSPMVIGNGLTQLLDGKRYTEHDLVQHDGLWHSFMHHGSFSGPDKMKVLQKINDRMIRASMLLPSIDILIMTFGTPCTYFLKEDCSAVNNCHKFPSDSFDVKIADSSALIDRFREVLIRWIEINPSLRVIVTVSPIRYLKYGLHHNQIYKSILLETADGLVNSLPDYVSYFPSYEIMLDELRDYRFYAEDLCHPNCMAINYIWERFGQAFFDNTTLSIVKECEDINKALKHRPLHPEDKAYQEFLNQLTLKINRLKEKCPYLEF